MLLFITIPGYILNFWRFLACFFFQTEITVKTTLVKMVLNVMTLCVIIFAYVLKDILALTVRKVSLNNSFEFSWNTLRILLHKICFYFIYLCTSKSIIKKQKKVFNPLHQKKNLKYKLATLIITFYYFN